MTPIKSVLLVEDYPGDARLLREMFYEREACDAVLTHVTTMCEAEQFLAEHVVDVILLDLGLSDAVGVAAVTRAHAAAPRVPLVVLTGLDDERTASQALQDGAQDYLIKGQIETRGLFRALRYAIERKSMEEALFAEKERAQITLACIADAVACSDVAGNITLLNAAAETLTGWSLKEATGRSLAEVVQVVDASGQLVPNTPQSLFPSEGPLDGSVWRPTHCILRRRDGHRMPVEYSIASIRDRQGQAAGSVIVFRDVSAARSMALDLAHLAEHDVLTGLPNRLLLNERINLAIALAKRHERKLGLLFLDLDGFKHINDSLGHAVGDLLLQSVAGRLVNCLRASDMVSRQGGDEFLILLSELAHTEDAMTAARRILQAVGTVHVIGAHALHVTTSIGVSVYPDDGLDAETLIKNADIAMYQAKKNGRHGIQFFEPAMNVRAIERQFIEEGLRRALELQELSLHYQPKIDLKSGRITGAEALVRWEHPTRGMVSPAQFIPVAEDTGLIIPIGKWVLREACRQARVWAAAGLSLPAIAVNVSAIELRSPTFLEGVFAILEESGLDPRTLELELTESVLMTHAQSNESILKELRAKGIRLALDDFGTGYSSLSYLGRFAVDTLKIDQSFVRHVTTAPEQATLVAAVIDIGRHLKLRTVAEGVETVEELAFLQKHGCDEAQGYYFSRPVTPENLARLLETGLPETIMQSLQAAKTPNHNSVTG